MTDIVPDLYERIRSDFERRVTADVQIRNFQNRIRDGTATMHELSLYASYLGEHAADALKANVTLDALPDGKMYYNIADRLIRPLLTENYELTNEAATQVQEIIDSLDNVRIKAVKAALPSERIDRIIWAVSEEGLEFEEIQKRMDEPVKNTSQSFADDYVKENAKFRYKAGMQPVITRTIAGDACKWCKNLAGTYRYPDEVPKDVYRRHDNCRCTVAYRTGKRQQNVWSKDWKEDETVLMERRSAGGDLVKRTPTEAARKAKAVTEQQEQRFEVPDIEKLDLWRMSQIEVETLATAIFANQAMDGGMDRAKSMSRAKAFIAGKSGMQLRNYIEKHR